MTKVCARPDCGNIFDAPPSGRRYCQRSCYDAMQRARGARATCEQCGKDYRQRKRTQRFCSVACRGRARRNAEDEYTVTGDLNCWIWNLSQTGGYGYLTINGKRKRAHILYWERANGKPVPEGYYLHHLCENTMCVNPRHLEAVTPAEHIARHNHRKLTPTTAKHARRAVARGMSRRRVATIMGVDEATIRAVCDGRHWTTREAE